MNEKFLYEIKANNVINLLTGEKLDKTHAKIMGYCHKSEEFWFPELNEEDIKELYDRLSIDVFGHIDGFFSIMLFDFEKQLFCISQNETGYAYPVYYTHTAESIVIGTTLKDVIKFSNRNSLCDSAVKRFINYGFVYGENTLIDGVYKLQNGYSLIYSLADEVLTTLKIKRKRKEFSIEDGKRIYDKYFENIIENYVKNNNHCATTLSTGFDSNYILSKLDKFTNMKIDAFSIGGRTGRDETETSKEIADSYSSISFNKAYVEETVILDFPKMVYALEDMYERGIFLQWILAKEVAAKGIKCIIEGDGADQVMKENLWERNNLDDYLGDVYLNPWHEFPHYLLTEVVIKKNSKFMLLNNVTPYYPYINATFRDIAYSIRKLNGSSKEYHKEIVLENISDKIKSLIDKKGGSTNLAYLFNSILSFEELVGITSKSRFKNTVCKLPTQYNKYDGIYDYNLKIMFLEIFEKIFLEKRYESITDVPNLEHFL